MDLIHMIGFVAAFCTAASFVPQVIQIIRTKDTKGISLGMYVVFTTGIICWLIYGILLNDFPIIAANAFTLLFASTILILKIKNG